MADTTFPRDQISITPHFHDAGALSDPENLCEDLATALDTLYAAQNYQITVKAYDAEKPKPNPPVATHVMNIGQAGPSAGPRELALCLSYYSGQNVPRKRGRLYLPVNLIGGVTPGVRPDASGRAAAAAFAPMLANLGGADVDWVVWSRKDQEAYPVTNWWVDDEWDVVRSRGLRPTTRTQGTTTEG